MNLEISSTPSLSEDEINRMIGFIWGQKNFRKKFINSKDVQAQIEKAMEENPTANYSKIYSIVTHSKGAGTLHASGKPEGEVKDGWSGRRTNSARKKRNSRYRY